MRAAPTIMLAGVLVGIGATAAQAQNIVANPGFETGDFTSWTQFDNTGFSGVGVYIPPHGGAAEAFFGPINSTGGIYQDLVTSPGTTYLFSFWLAQGNLGDPSGQNAIQVDWGGTLLLGIVDEPNLDWTQYVFQPTASQSSTRIRFTFLNDPTYWFLDDVTVQAEEGNIVPEPATMSLLALGLAGMAGAGLRRKKRSVA